ncbi:MAG: integrating conjugative element protein [Gammaproteobacteria bacterium]|nr:integrating conjugative element protein [Gammaproteobacteria bacterium]MDZ7753204.1 integrating conjugative element protein [Gammaproteobacteria bacterium]
MRMARTVRILPATLGLWSAVACAELTVIYDSGATAPLAPYLEAFSERPPAAPVQAQPEVSLGAADLTRLLPIRTPALTPGPVSPRPLSLPNGATLPRPLFLIGADPLSRQWLETHRERLAAIHGVGLLVNAESAADLEAIATIARGLPILPASATDIAEILGLKHIPVLISRRGIEQ